MRKGWMLAALLFSADAWAGAKEAALTAAIEKIWNDGDLTIIDEAYAPDIAPKIKEFVIENRALYPDIKVTIDSVVVKGPHWITTWTVTGTHKDLKKPVKLQGVSVRTREGGVFTSESMFYDMKSVYDQLGFRVVPPEGATPFGPVVAAAPHPETGDGSAPAPAPEGAPAPAPEGAPAPEAPAPAPAPEAPAPAPAPPADPPK